MKSLQKDLEDALRRARGDADHFKKQLTEAHRVAMSQASVAASVHAATSQVHISNKLSIQASFMTYGFNKAHTTAFKFWRLAHLLNKLLMSKINLHISSNFLNLLCFGKRCFQPEVDKSSQFMSFIN